MNDEHNTRIPPHVAATDARRAACMNRVTNEKLGEWSQRISLIMERIVTEREWITNYQDLAALQADIVRAMGEPGQLLTPEGIGRAIENARAEKETRPAQRKAREDHD